MTTPKDGNKLKTLFYTNKEVSGQQSESYGCMSPQTVLVPVYVRVCLNLISSVLRPNVQYMVPDVRKFSQGFMGR